MSSTLRSARARDLGIPFAGTPGPLNAITDVAGVLVGHTTLIHGEGRLQVGEGPVRTGVTVILPRGREYDPVFAATAVLNGNGEMTGTIWVEESGFLESPIGLTNTHSVGTVRDAIARWQYTHNFYDALPPGHVWMLPVVAETYDGALNDIHGQHVTAEHVFAALDDAQAGPVAEGCIGSGTGMICHGYKGGLGTASRVLTIGEQSYTLGVLLQANHGQRDHLTIAGVPVGEVLEGRAEHDQPDIGGMGSIIVIVATDAPLLPHQLKRLARRVSLGIGRVGGVGEHSSGDIFLAFSTANPGAARRQGVVSLRMLANDEMTGLFDATVQATEEAICNALVAATTMTGVNGYTVPALPHDEVQAILQAHGRLARP